MNPRRARQKADHAFVLVRITCCILLIPSCSHENDKDASSKESQAKVPQEEELLVFPEDLYVTDISVNVFVMNAMKACASGDYEAFRIMWSVKQDPLTREEFNQGWQAAKKIRVRVLERVMFADQSQSEDLAEAKGEMVFAMLADVELDPTHPAGRRNPRREAVLMILKEQDQWRLARAPKAMRAWIKKRVDEKEVSIDSD